MTRSCAHLEPRINPQLTPWCVTLLALMPYTLKEAVTRSLLTWPAPEVYPPFSKYLVLTLLPYALKAAVTKSLLTWPGPESHIQAGVYEYNAA